MTETQTLLNTGLAQMLKGGVIMDVVNEEQARIAEAAGASAVMALERVPADIRAQGGVARMSDPDLIDSIISAVSIPVMAKARIGHFVEAQILETLGVDYIDESEVLSPADYVNHIDKSVFKVPFVCGATNLGEALRRITEGASMIRSKGEAGTGDVSEAMRHLRTINSEIRALGAKSEDELYVAAKEIAAPYHLVKQVASLGRLPVVTFVAGGIATPADAAMMMQLGADGVFVGSGIFKSGNPEAPRRPSSKPPRTSMIRRPWPEHPADSAMRWSASTSPMSHRTAWPSAAGESRRLALQGAFREHLLMLGSLGVDTSRSPVRTPRRHRCTHPARRRVQAMVRIAAGTDLFATLRERMAGGLPVFGTCAGLILLSDRLSDDSLGGFDRLGGLDITVARNAYGRQRESFTAPLTVQGLDEPVAGTFIRAPQILDLGPEVEVLASHNDTPVLVRQGAIWGASFHPELGTDGRIHAEFLHHLGAAV